MRGKHSEPFDGWLTKYKTDRLLSDYEVQARLDPKVSVSLPPIDNGMLKVNSVFLEYMDRHFFFRGYAALGGLIITVFNMWAGVMLLITSGEPMHDGVLPTTMEALFMQMFSLPFFALFLWIFKGAVLRDFFVILTTLFDLIELIARFMFFNIIPLMACFLWGGMSFIGL